MLVFIKIKASRKYIFCSKGDHFMKQKVLIIGAGMGGLTTAIKLQHAGYHVEIFEQLSMPGGKMHQLKSGGYTFDVGPTIVMMPKVYADLFTLAGKNPKDYISLTRLEPMYDIFFKGKPYRNYKASSDLYSLMVLAEEKGEKNATGFLKYLSEIYTRYRVALEYFITKPFRSYRDIYNPFMLLQAYKLKTFDSAENMMAKFLPDKDLQRMLSFQTLYIGVSPKKGPSLYNMIPMIELLYGVWFLKGGMHSMAIAMAKLFEELGGKIHYTSPVSKILIKDANNQKKAFGLISNNKEHHADYIVCNADFPYALTSLIDDKKAKGKYTNEKIETMDYSCSCLVFYWGVDGTFDKLSTHNFVISEDLDDNLKSIFDGRLLTDPSIYLHIPSKSDSSMAPEGKSSFYVLMPVSELITAQYKWTDETIAHYKQKALNSLSKLPDLQNLSEKIELEMIYTPKDFEKSFSAYRGATFGLQPTLRQSNHWRPQSKSQNCENLYFTGSSTHPGAGVPIAIQGGIICAEELRRDNPEDKFR